MSNQDLAVIGDEPSALNITIIGNDEVYPKTDILTNLTIPTDEVVIILRRGKTPIGIIAHQHLWHDEFGPDYAALRLRYAAEENRRLAAYWDSLASEIETLPKSMFPTRAQFEQAKQTAKAFGFVPKQDYRDPQSAALSQTP